MHYWSPDYICKNGKMLKNSYAAVYETFRDLTEEEIRAKGGLCADCHANRENDMQYGRDNYERC